MTTHLRSSRTLARLRAGEVCTVMKVNLADARVVEMAARAGFDCVWADLEHVGNDISAIEQAVWATKAYDTDLVVRVARGSYSDYIRPLELDATGIMVPHVMSLADAERIVEMTRFQPIGRRPLDGGNSDGGFCAVPLADYLSEANDQRFVIVQIEDPEPLEELDEIAALPGIDMLFFGAGDFSHAIGAPGQWDHPLITETRARIAEVAATHGKFAGAVGTVDSLDDLVALGYRFISLGADVVGLHNYFTDIMSVAAGKNVATASYGGPRT